MRRRVLAAAIFGLAGTAVLAGLGVWQLERLAWKEALIARLESRLSAEPVPLPAAPDPERDNFLRVAVEGRVGDEALYLLTSERPFGPGFRVIAPLASGGAGRTVLVDLGYIPEAMKGAGVAAGAAARVTGALYWPEARDSFTPEPDRAANIWFARDPQAMAAALGAEPLLIVADAHDLGAWPKPLRLGVNLRNDHLGYAVTWFAMAAIWAAMSLGLARGEARRSS
ncbi:MAG TPA: SURF1 family protein [Thermohalobaculum sp.]|nr:SURF1 family protein [Thermohalobaculum sp.]